MDDAEVKTKVCSKCNESKLLSEFHKDKTKTLGVKSACKDCIKPNSSLYGKAYYEKNKETVKLQNKKYYEENRRTVNERHKKHYYDNKEANREQKSKYARENRHIYNANHAKRRSLEVAYTPEHLRNCPEEIARLKSVYLLSRLISKHTGTIHHVDHMWPLSDGGPHWSGNLQIITATDNFKKNATVCEGIKSVVRESLEWEIERYKNERTNTRDS